MTAGGRERLGGKMPCESCAVQFSVFKRKRACCECERYYCSGCLRRGGGAMCAPCRALSTRPLLRNNIAHLKVRDLQCFLQRQNVSTRGCVEKEELVSLCVSHVNGPSYRRRGARSSGAFSSLKGFTNNINDFINNAFDLRTSPPTHVHNNTQQTHNRDCFNSSHTHRASSPPQPPGAPSRPPERFTTTPGGERDIEVPVPAPAQQLRTPSTESARVDTADCFEIEDLDDAGWELVTRPADPLPNDSDILISAAEADALRRDSQPEAAEGRTRHASPPRGGRPGQPRPEQPADRHSTHSEFETISNPARSARPTISREYLTPGLSGSGSGLSAGAGSGLSASSLELGGARAASPDTASLQDELSEAHADSTPASPQRGGGGGVFCLARMRSASELEALSVKQLKELLARNRVEFRGCVERRELEERAARLWREMRAQPPPDDLPIEDACKICMAAPLECVLLECGHIAACTACAKQLAECPICRQYVVRAVRFFRS